MVKSLAVRSLVVRILRWYQLWSMVLAFSSSASRPFLYVNIVRSTGRLVAMLSEAENVPLEAIPGPASAASYMHV
jgi:hypothetical protein